MDKLRSSVRPIITFIIIIVLAIAALIACFKFMDAAMANKIMDAVIPMAGMLAAFWFGSRTSNPKV